jgi:SAM-dependent methyltransferase
MDQSAAKQHWDHVHGRGEVITAAIDDAVGAAALEHFGDITGKRLLDLGCGLGEYSLFFAEHGAQVTAIDTSAVAIEALRAHCAQDSIANVNPVVASAFDIDQLGPFDAVFGSMILHHLEPFDHFAEVLRAAMVPGGRAFFYENSANAFLVWCREHLTGRFGIPKYGDDEEFPLQRQEIDELRGAFTVDVVHPELFFVRLASGYLLRGHGERAFTWIDERLYRFPRARRLSYRQYVLLTRNGS